MFPDKADIEFFKEAKRIQEGWEPKFGDLVFTNTKHVAIFVGLDPFAHDDKGDRLLVLTGKGDTDYLWRKYASNVIWLPRQGQLQEMLEERGYDWMMWGSGRYYRCEFKIPNNLESIPCRRTEGPTPSIALGKCLLEVLCVQHPEDAAASEGKEE